MKCIVVTGLLAMVSGIFGAGDAPWMDRSLSVDERVRETERSPDSRRSQWQTGLT